MQLLSLAALTPDAQRLLEDINRADKTAFPHDVLVLGGVSIVLWIVCAWAGSQVAAKEKAGFAQAIRTGFAWSVAYLGVALLAGAAFYFAKLRGSTTMASVSIVIGGIMALYASVSAPMKIYVLPFTKAFKLAYVAMLIFIAAQIALQPVLGRPLALAERIAFLRRFNALPPADAAQFLETVRNTQAVVVLESGDAPSVPSVTPIAVATPKPLPTATPKPAPPTGESVAERLEKLKKTYDELVARRAGLQTGDDEGAAAYVRDSARYTEQLEKLQKEAAAEKK